MPMPMNQIESLRLQGAYHSPRLRLRNLREEIVKLDTNLMDRDTLRKAAFQHLVLETLDINLQQVDEIVPMQFHLTRKAGAGMGLASARL